MNYTNKHAVMGMLSKRSIPFEDFKGYLKNRNEVVVFNQTDLSGFKHPKINVHYSDSKDIEAPVGYSLGSQYKSTLVVSEFTPEYFQLSGKKYREVREARNKYNRELEVIDTLKNKADILTFIEEWKKVRGEKQYGWQLHIGYDINFFEKYYEAEAKNLICKFLYCGEKLLGYAVISNLPEDGVYTYMLRKTFPEPRNICLYLDYKVFEEINKRTNSPFKVNWGCSSGSVLKYKESKFPLRTKETKYFTKFKQV